MYITIGCVFSFQKRRHLISWVLGILSLVASLTIPTVNTALASTGQTMTIAPVGHATWDELVAIDAQMPRGGDQEYQIIPFMPMPKPREVGSIVSPPTPSDATDTKGYQQESGLKASPTGNGFQALADNNTVIPPDTHGAVGLNHVMTMLNSQVRIHNKSGNIISTVSLAAFWSPTGATGFYDPHIIYDQSTNRWYATCDSDRQSAASSVLFAISDTGDPTGPWKWFRIDADPTDVNWADYPDIGFNNTWIAITNNMFTVAADAFSGAAMWVIDKTGALAGTLTVTRFATGFDNPNNGDGFSLRVCHTFGSEPKLYIVDNSGWMSGGKFMLRISEISGTGSAPVWKATGPGNGLFQVVNNFNFTQIKASQPGTTTEIATNDPRMLNAVFRNGHIWCTHSGGLPATGTSTRTAVFWYELDPLAISSKPIFQSGFIDGGSGVHHFFPSITANANDDALIGFTRSSANLFAEAVYTGRLANQTPLNTMEPITVMKVGEDSYVKKFSGPSVRWGDFSATVVDPTDDISFWTIQEYAAADVGPAANDDRWGTWWSYIGPDLFIRDNLADDGTEPNSYSQVWRSPEIWTNPNQYDKTETMVDPVYGNNTYVHVKVTNRGVIDGSGRLFVYWAKASTGLSWPTQWVNYKPPLGTFGNPIDCPYVLYGDQLGSAPMSITVPAGKSEFFHFLWNTVPHPEDFACFTWFPADNLHFCLLARIETNTASPYGMTYPEGNDICQNVRNNNNIAWRNFNVVDSKKKSPSPQPYIVHNIHDTAAIVSLAFQLPAPEGDSSFLAYGQVYAHFRHELFERWLSHGGNGTGIQIVGDSVIRVVEPSAIMSNIPMGPDESSIFAVEISVLPEFQCQEKETFRCDVTQISNDIDGGVSLDILVGAPPCPIITIEKTHGTLQGHFQNVSITTEGSLFEMGGFDFLIAYDAAALVLTKAEQGQLLKDCDWEYFTYRYGADGNCGDACPSGLLRLIGLAETNNGPNHPSCYSPPDCDPHELAVMTFLVTNDRTFNGQYIPIKFFWGDCGDNSISSVDGGTLYIDRAIYDFEGNVIWDEEDDVQYPKNARIPFVGTPDDCLNPNPNKPTAERCPEFVNGGIDIIPDTAIDARGDINCNGLANEVADAVMYTNYFILGPVAFENHAEASIAASDVNADGIALSVADLVYIVRIITGDASPFPKPMPYAVEASVNAQVNHSAVGVSATSPTDIGAGYFVFEYSGLEVGEPQLINGASAMSLKYGNDKGLLKVLVYSLEKGVAVPAGAENIFVIPIHGNGTIRLTDAQLSDYQGNLLAVKTEAQSVLPKDFALHQNYPNPFNAGTTIIYELPQASHVKIEITNVLGQMVATAFDAQESAGIHSVQWNGTDDLGRPVASGIYIYRMAAGAFSTERKMVLLK